MYIHFGRIAFRNLILQLYVVCKDKIWFQQFNQVKTVDPNLKRQNNFTASSYYMLRYIFCELFFKPTMPFLGTLAGDIYNCITQ